MRKVWVIVGLISGLLFAGPMPAQGDTPGFYINWENHYTEGEFRQLLQGTIADDDIDAAMDYLTSFGCDDDDAIHCLRRFLLANQLTVNLTTLSINNASFPNPNGTLLGLGTRLESDGLTLGKCILDATNAIIEVATLGPALWDRDKILEIKDILDEFANLEFE